MKTDTKVRKNKEGRITLFLKPKAKAKLQMLAFSKNTTATQVVENWVNESELDLSDFES